MGIFPVARVTQTINKEIPRYNFGRASRAAKKVRKIGPIHGYANLKDVHPGFPVTNPRTKSSVRVIENSLIWDSAIGYCVELGLAAKVTVISFGWPSLSTLRVTLSPTFLFSDR